MISSTSSGLNSRSVSIPVSNLDDSVFTNLTSLSHERSRRKSAIQHKIALALINDDEDKEALIGSDSDSDDGESKKDKKPGAATDYVTFDESPHHILKVAAQGNLNELIRLVNISPTKLYIQDYRGLNIVHHASQWSRIEVLEYLYLFVDIGLVDMNDQDKLGNTPLHFAIERNQRKALDWLLSHGCDLRICNILHQAPVHLAVEIGNLALLRRVIEEDPDIIHYPGDLGFTPLLYACRHDRPEIARFLLENGADMMYYCDVGYCAIHCATRNGCPKIVDVLIEYSEKRGISGFDLIHTLDKEDNLPLHAAVNSGDLRAVLVCLKAGADISALQVEDKQTSIHYAAAKGASDILKAMFEAQPNKVDTCLGQCDILDQTPLHKAAMFNHIDVVRYLLDMGASINCQDEQRRTPLLLAASKNAVQVVNFLLSKRAYTSIKDNDNHNFLHMAILTGMKLKHLNLAKLKNLKTLLNERDDFGACPAHYASRAGQLATLRGLLKLGAYATIKDFEKQNPLHVAARYGRIHSCKNLLSTEYGQTLLFEINGEGHNAVHIAALYGHAGIISVMLRKGGQITKDFQLNTPFHLAAANGHFEAVVLLLGMAPHLLNKGNRAGNTALHLAASNNQPLILDHLLTVGAEFSLNYDGASFIDLAILKDHTDATAATIRHSRCEEAMNLSSVFGRPVIGLIQHLPDMCVLFLDKYLIYSEGSHKSDDFYVQFNFRPLITPEDIKGQKFDTVGKVTHLWTLNAMVKYNRVSCLSHPLCVTYLNQKWNAYGTLVYNIRLILFIFILLLLTTISYEGDKAYGEYLDERNRAIEAGVNPEDFKQFSPELIGNGMLIRMIIVTLYAAFGIALHVVNVAQNKMKYFFDSMNYFELTFYFSILVLAVPGIINSPNVAAQYISSSICMFLGWMNFLFQMQRFTFFGHYIVMFQEIFKTLMRALCVYSFVLIAFALSLTLVFRTYSGRMLDFINPFQTFLTMLPMMWGDSNFEEYIVPSLDKEKHLRTLFPNMTYVLYFLFIILAGVLCKNILIGLAVGNIESVQRNARLKRLATQVLYFTGLEGLLPNSFLKKRQVLDYKYYPNIKVNRLVEFFKTLVGHGRAGTVGDESAEGFGNGQFENENEEFQYIQQQLSLQSRRLNTLVGRFEMHRNLAKVISSMLENEVFSNDKQTAEREMESGDDEEDAFGAKKRGQRDSESESTSFHSAAATAQWHAINKRMANIKRPKTNIWVSSDVGDGDDD